MRINKFVAQATGMSRRAADQAIAEGRVLVDGTVPSAGDSVDTQSVVTIDGAQIFAQDQVTTIALNKPEGYVCSRNGQGSKTVYDLLPKELHHLKSVGRLDKDSSGLLLMTSDGDLANKLTHPRYEKTKVYEITLNVPLQPLHRQMIQDTGIKVEGYVSRFSVERITDSDDINWRVTLSEGKNRQIRKTFEALDYKVVKLHRSNFGPYTLGQLPLGKFKEIL
jgi:23S rRNA pseudouridine2605 synthase